MGYSPASAASNVSNLSSNSSGSHYRNYHTSPITSPPFSTPPSSSSPSTTTTPGTHHPHYPAPVPTTGTKGNLSRRNSGTKLSALAEERERRRSGIKKTKKSTVSKSGGGGTEKTNSGGFDIITQSCLLGFSGDEEEEEGEGEGREGDTASLELEEENFPLSLTMSLTDQEEEDNEGEVPGGRRSHAYNQRRPDVMMSGNAVQILGSDAVRYAPATTPSQPRPKSSVGRKGETASGSTRPKRASSFSHQQRSSQLSQELAALHTKASSLSAHGDPFVPGFSAATPHLTSSPSAEIVAFKLPFTFSGSTAEEDKLEGGSCPPAPPTPGREGEEGEGEDGNVCFGSLKLSSMKDSLVLAREMHAMAKARQGPILLMSTSADLVCMSSIQLGYCL